MTKIRVVDDDAHIRELVCHFLQQEGFDTYEAFDGVEGVGSLRHGRAERGSYSLDAIALITAASTAVFCLSGQLACFLGENDVSIFRIMLYNTLENDFDYFLTMIASA